MIDPNVQALQPWFHNSAQTLGALLGDDAECLTVNSYLMTPSEMSEQLPGEVFHLTVSLSGGLVGPAIFGLKLDQVLPLAAVMLGEEAAPSQASALHKDVMGEALVQLASFLSPCLERATGRQVSVTAGEAQVGPVPEVGAPLYVGFEVPVRFTRTSELDIYLFLPAGLAEELSDALRDNDFEEEFDDLPEPPPSFTGLETSSVATIPELAGTSGKRATLEVEPEGSNDCLEAIGDIPVEVTAVLGKAPILVEDLLTLTPGSLIELEKQVSQPVELYVRKRRLAIGEVVVVDEHFGVSVLEMVSEDRRPDISQAVL